MLKYDCSPPRKYPHKDPFFGLDMFLKFAKAIERGNLLPTVENYFSEFGKTFQSTAFGTTIINTMDPRVVQSVLATEFDKFGVAPTRKSAFGPLIRDGIFTLDGASWVHSRAMLKPIFSSVRVSSIDNIKEHVDRLLQLIPRNSETIDLQPLLKRLFLDKSTQFLFGVSQDSLLRGSSDETSEDFISAFDCVLQGLNARYFLGSLSFLLGREKKLKADIAQVHGFVDQYVEMAIRRRKEIVAGIPLERSQRYVLLDELVSTTSDKNELRNQALNLFLPARDTTASAISFIFFHLARNPRVWEKLRDEVMEISDIPLTFDILKTMKYLKHVINESLRLLAPAGLSIRTCTQDCVLPYGGGTSGQSPLFVQKGTEIRIVFHAMHKDSDFWGEDALRFRPERWEGMRTTWEYIPFLGGGRICPAQQMVLVESSYLVARFVQSFTGIENRDEEVEFVERHKMQMESRNGVKVAFRV